MKSPVCILSATKRRLWAPIGGVVVFKFEGQRLQLLAVIADCAGPGDENLEYGHAMKRWFDRFMSL